MALGDIKGKALGVPVYNLLGATRDYIECYATGFRASKAANDYDRAKDCIAAGLRAYRTGPTGGNGEERMWLHVSDSLNNNSFTDAQQRKGFFEKPVVGVVGVA